MYSLGYQRTGSSVYISGEANHQRLFNSCASHSMNVDGSNSSKVASNDKNSQAEHAVNSIVNHPIYGDTYTQHTPEWYSMRKKLITASVAPYLLPMNRTFVDPFNEEFPEFAVSISTRATTVKTLGGSPLSGAMEYLTSSSGDTHASRWGNDFEDIAVQQFCNDAQCSVERIGLVVHKDYKWLGCSPDGMIGDDMLLEIKCPINTKHTVPAVALSIKLANWVQAQVQMEVMDREYCVLAKYLFAPYLNHLIMAADKVPRLAFGAQMFDYRAPYTMPLVDAHQFSFVTNPLFFQKVTQGSMLAHVGPSQTADDVFKNVMVYIKNLQDIISSGADPKLKVNSQYYANELSSHSLRFWYLQDYSIYKVKRNREWFREAKDLLYEQWCKIQVK